MLGIPFRFLLLLILCTSFAINAIFMLKASISCPREGVVDVLNGTL